ncbi:tRNA uracil 4-sulfurtransferase ThiI [Paenibacillus sp. GCM10027626]|uniref:tRNA uracil 4-sulfurtransferase ThiI n=1 Tax=Paenibacillus sp. GCM10027626 TaxID=3273411 RepID=UPI00362C0B57
MKVDMILVRFGEFTIKGRNRGWFERKMLSHVRAALADFPEAEIKHTYGRIYVTLNDAPYEPVKNKLRNVFGIVSISPVRRVESQLEKIQAVALELMLSLPAAPATFKVATRRVDKSFPHETREMNHLVGSHVLRAMPELKVDVRNPAVELRVEIQAEGTFVFSEVIPAAGGFPYGTNGKATLLLSGGIDSPVAGYLAMRRGLELDAVHFHSYPYTSEQAQEKVIALGRKLVELSNAPLKLHMVPFTEIQTTLKQSNQDHLLITLMRRAMLRIAERIADRNKASALVTGDSLGQVASQTLGSMNVIGRVINMPLLRPLVMSDKSEIIRIAEQIDTYETSILPFEDCCTLFVPKSPSTNPNLNVVQKIESSLVELEAMIERAVTDSRTIVLKPGQRAEAEQAGEDQWF